MLKQLKRIVRDFIKGAFGEGIILTYHKLLAQVATAAFGNPSKKMFVVAVTGTKGKTSTLNFLWHVLTAGGYKVGLISTANIKIGDKEILNWYHMTMPGRFLLQKLLWRMYKARCDIVLVEATSEGIKMNRHIGLFYDVAIFTNLFPEHLQSHNNSFEEYRNTKGILFQNLMRLPPKRWNGMDLEKIIIANGDDKNADYFLGFPADKKFVFGDGVTNTLVDYKFSNIVESSFSVKFALGEENYELSLPGKFNIYNAIPAILLAKNLEIPTEKIQKGLKNCTQIPGRMERIDEGQNFTAVVDYAHEAVSMENAIRALLPLKKNKDNKLIVVFGGDGGGREPRTEMVRVISQLADVGIITLSDPFDTEPQKINDFLMERAIEFGMKKNENIFETIDRREAIRKAVSLAKEGDVLLFTCKGAEQSIVFADRVEPWDDRTEVRHAIKKMLSKKIDGKKISEEIGKKLLQEIKEAGLKQAPSLGIVCVGEDAASLKFVNVKKKFGDKYGFKVNLVKLSEGVGKEEVKDELVALQKENDSVILQLPLPERLKPHTENILQVIQAQKDVDNLNGGDFQAPIVLALQKVLEIVGMDVKDKIFGIVGLGQVVGMPIYNYLVGKNYLVKKIGRENFYETKECDILISGVGRTRLIKPEDIKENCILIDYGCSSVIDTDGKEKMCGDFDEACFEKAQFYTPVPGCMGPLVVAMLFSNVLGAALKGR